MFTLENVQKGYAEFYNPDNAYKEQGYVCKEQVVKYTDFDNDKIVYCDRWFPYVGQNNIRPLTFGAIYYIKVGNCTGYETRQEALQAAYSWIHEYN